MAKRIVAVLGTGNAGMSHLRALRKIKSVRALAVPLRPRRRAELKKAGFETAESLKHAAEKGSRACVIATDTGRHVRDAIAAIHLLGMNVLVEKPMGSTASETRKLIAAAGRSRRKVYVGCVMRFSKAIQRARKLLDRIGKIHAVDIECRAFLPDWRTNRSYRQSCSARANEGGVLRDLIHEIDYAGWLFGWPKAVYGKLGSTGRLKIASEEWAELFWQNGSRIPISIRLDYLTRKTRRSMLVHGEKGTLEWNAVSDKVTLRLAGRKPVTYALFQPGEGDFLEQMRAFLRSIAGKVDARFPTGQEGFQALAVCDAARKSSKTNRLEPVAKGY